MKAMATKEFKRLGKKPVELMRIPEPGEIFNISPERFYILSGHNKYKAIFVVEPDKNMSIFEDVKPEEVQNPDDIVLEDYELSSEDVIKQKKTRKKKVRNSED